MSDKLKIMQTRISKLKAGNERNLHSSSAGYPELSLVSNLIEYDFQSDQVQPILPHTNVLIDDQVSLKK